MDNFQAISAFLAVAETGSLSRAALKLGKTPSAITKAINALEAALGTRLLTRTTRQVALTEAGRIYLETASEAMAQLGHVAQRIRELDGMPRGRLRITAPLSFGRAVLSAFCPDFMQRYPEVELEVSLADRYVDLVAENFDLALRLGHHDLPGQIARVVGDNRVLVCASPDYLAAAPPLAEPEDLAQHRCLIYRHPLLNPALFFSRDGQTRRIEPVGRFQSDNFDLLLDAACAGQGVLPCPRWSAWQHVQAGRLRQVLPDYVCTGEGFGREHVYAVYPATRRNSLKVRLFMEQLQQWMDSHFAAPGQGADGIFPDPA
ncbi:LysR family transcriptional regulator [Vogesella sp. LIG4]|uniref:LysR family transcriptional regulator n=1 Tax=Vogesella sp. LIG4 TaxID=1192162 RepID=UPI00081FE3D7|nr:LysR family transcriptional regulator [Vogesella sp. LIG4]SCK19185.1 transcriptional regulator, LysR family [Vogesella sp. LIG4]